MPENRSFRAKLFVRIFPILALIIALEAIFSTFIIHSLTREELEARINLLGTDISRTHFLAASIKSSYLWQIEDIANSRISMPDVVYFGISNNENERIYEDSRPGSDNVTVITKEFPLIYYSSGITLVDEPDFHQQEKLLQGMLILGYNPEFADKWSRVALSTTLITSFLFLILISFGIDYAFRTSIGNPLKHLARAIRKSTDTDTIDYRDDEIGRVLKQYNQMMDQQSYLLNAAQRLSNSGSWGLDPKTGEMVWSKQLYEILGADVNQFKPTLDLAMQFVHPDERSLVKTACTSDTPEFDNYNSEIRIIRHDGQERIAYFQTHCFRDKDGKLERLVGNLTDVTERKRQESERQQSMKMIALGSLASGMAHSLNNLILPILISSRMALKGLNDDKAATRERLERVITSSVKADALISKVLDFSRQKETSDEVFDISRVVRDSLRLIQVTAPTSIRIESNLVNHPIYIVGQPSQVETAILDIASNAFYSMQGTNGQLSIEFCEKNIETSITGYPSSVLPGHFACLIMTDTGVGMSEEVLEKAFQPFFTTKPDGLGTGLGLANMEGVVTAHQGYLQVTSTVGKGTRFSLYFPITEQTFNTTQNGSK